MPLFRLFSGRNYKQGKGAGSGRTTSTIHDPAFAISATVGHVTVSPDAARKKRLDPFNYRYEEGHQGEEVGSMFVRLVCVCSLPGPRPDADNEKDLTLIFA